VLPSDGLLQRHAPLAPVEGVPGVWAHQSADVFALWKAWEVEAGCEQDTPFWATVWPAARVLAGMLLEGRIDVAGRRVLDLGCGGAVVAVAALKAGAARVTGNDTDRVALHVAGRNARANGSSLVLDTRDITGTDAAGHDIVFIADMFYEKSVAERTVGLLERLRRRGVTVYLSDGGRPFAPRDGGSEVERASVAVDGDLEGLTTRTVRVVRFGPLA
jgi:predicted nicotinamide N-methyase